MSEVKGVSDSELPTQEGEAEGPSLERGHLPMWKAAVLALSALQIGPAIALAAGSVTEFVGLKAWMTFAIAAGAICCVAIAVTSCAKRYVVTGSLISYVSLTLGVRARDVTAASLILGYLVMAATITATAVVFTTSALIDLGFQSAAGSKSQCVSAVAISAFAAACAYRGVDASVRVATTFSFLCLPFVIYITVVAGWREPLDFAGQFHGFRLQPDRLLQGTMAAFANFVCFDGLTALAAETKDPLRNVPRILSWALGVTGFFVILACVMQTPILVANAAAVTAGASPIAVLADRAGLGYLKVSVDLLLAPAVIASVVALYNYGARVLATAAFDGLLPRVIGGVHRKHHSPHRAVIVLGVAGGSLPAAMQLLASTPPLLGAVYLGNFLCYFWLLPYVLVCIGASKMSCEGTKVDRRTLAGSMAGAVIILALLVAALWFPSPGLVGHLPLVAMTLIALLSTVYVLMGKPARAAKF